MPLKAYHNSQTFAQVICSVLRKFILFSSSLSEAITKVTTTQQRAHQGLILLLFVFISIPDNFQHFLGQEKLSVCVFSVCEWDSFSSRNILIWIILPSWNVYIIYRISRFRLIQINCFFEEVICHKKFDRDGILVCLFSGVMTPRLESFGKSL